MFRPHGGPGQALCRRRKGVRRRQRDRAEAGRLQTLYIPAGGGLGVAVICAKPTPEILKLQADIIAAAAPFNLRNGPIGAFTAGHDNPAIDAAIIQYVSTFEQIGAGEHFNPHVSTGTAPTDYLDKMNAEPFESFTFSPAGAAVFQLGPFGTAAKKLKEVELGR